MSLPPVTKSWTFAPNNRISSLSLLDNSSRLMFGIKTFLVTTMGYTLKYSCDGTTGPASSSDHTDRWTTFANAQTRAATLTAGPQSFVVLTNGSGCDILITYAGSSDDSFVVAFSPSGLYIPAGTPTRAPTATDSQTFATGSSMIGTTVASDRVWHIMATTDKTIFRVFVYRLDVMFSAFGVEAIQPTVNPTVNFVGNSVGWMTTNSTMTSVGAGHVLGSATSNNQGMALVNSLSCVIAGCGECFQSSAANPLPTDLSAGAIIVPCGYVSTTAGAAGKLGNRFDCWYAYNTPTPGQGDSFGDLTHVLFGTGVWPWDGVTYPEIS